VTTWIVVLLAGLGTWALRASLILAFGRFDVPPRLERSFRYVGPSVMAAIALPGLLAPDGAVEPFDPRVAGGIVAAIVAWWTESLLLTLVAGLTVTGLLLWLV
jgi:branched-subunit amino acid transport protein